MGVNGAIRGPALPRADGLEYYLASTADLSQPK